MLVAVVEVREVGVTVCQRQMAMPVRMWLTRRIRRGVRVLMVLIVDVAMLVFQFLVRVSVHVLLAQVQVQADSHEHAGRQQAARHGLRKQPDGEQGANERGGRKVRGRAGRSEIS